MWHFYLESADVLSHGDQSSMRKTGQQNKNTIQAVGIFQRQEYINKAAHSLITTCKSLARHIKVYKSIYAFRCSLKALIYVHDIQLIQQEMTQVLGFLVQS